MSTKRLAFFGSDYFAHNVLSRILSESKHRISTRVFTTPINAKSKKHEMLKYCNDNSIDVSIPVWSNSKKKRKEEWQTFSACLRDVPKFDLGIVCSYGYMIDESIISHFNNVDSYNIRNYSLFIQVYYLNIGEHHRFSMHYLTTMTRQVYQ